MHSFRIFQYFLFALLIICAPLAAQSVDTQSVTITYNGSSSPNTATINVTNATNVTARIGTNLNDTGVTVSSGGDTPGVFVQNVSANATGFSVGAFMGSSRWWRMNPRGGCGKEP